MDNEENIIQLEDENGTEINFELVMTLENDGNRYIVLEAAEDMDDCKQGEAIILKVVADENGDDVYATIEDEAEFQTVFDKCVAALDEDDGDEDDDTDDK